MRWWLADGKVAAMFTLPSMSQLTAMFGQPAVFAPGSWLRRRHAPMEHVLYLESGCVLLGVAQQEQMRHQLGRVEGPLWLDAAFAMQQRLPCMDMQAQGHVRVHSIPVAAFRQALAELQSPVQMLLQDLARAYCTQAELAVSRLAQDAEARCVQWLLHHAVPHEKGYLRVTLHARKQSIAAQLGMAPETLSRILRQLRERGLIGGRGNVIDLPEPGALRTLALGSF